MTRKHRPAKQGLYDPANERDACGVGFVVDMKGRPKHDIIPQALQVLKNLAHRGACGCEVNTGDGAGILFQIPDRFFRKVCPANGINLPPAGRYGVGMMYLPPDVENSRVCEAVLEKMIAEEGQVFLGWREVPVNNAGLGQSAKACEPRTKQVFIAASSDIVKPLDFERKLYLIRKRAEHHVRSRNLKGSEYFYASSFSSRTIVYKGMLTSEQVETYFPDLLDKDVETSLALVHSRFSTNTFPSWERAHPYRYIIHNGEINTLRGNVSWMKARQALFASDLFGADFKKLLPIIDEEGSDSSMFDNAMEFFYLSGRSLPHVAMMMIPEPWSNYTNMDPKLKAFYEYHACLMEPWDGPASMAFTDGTRVGAVLDRNGLRPSRYYVMKDGRVIMASEVGVLDVPPEDVLYKGRLQPGRMLLIDTVEGRIIADEEIKNTIAEAHPYPLWLEENLIHLKKLPAPRKKKLRVTGDSLITLQKTFGYTLEDINILVGPMAMHGVEAIGSMGTDTPLTVLSERPQMIYGYFKQLFAQVTNPPIDSIREEIVTGHEIHLGTNGNILQTTAALCRQIRLKSPFLLPDEFEKLRNIKQPGFKSATFDILFKAGGNGKDLENAMAELFKQADEAIEKGINLLILSDRGVSADKAPIPALLAVAGLHHHLIRCGTRMRADILLESGEPRSVHDFALLLGYGVGAVCPYVVFETLKNLIGEGVLDIQLKLAMKHYIKALVKGVTKTMAKMGISTYASYRGAQIFEAVGLNREVIQKYFTWTASRLEGIGLDGIAEETCRRHRRAHPDRDVELHTLEPGGQYKWRADGEYHLLNPQTVHQLQRASRNNDYNAYRKFADEVNQQSNHLCTLRGLLKFKNPHPIPLDEVEPIETIVKRFKTGAMSYGSISQEAHETLAIAMNRLGGRSNTGEGGEDPARFIPDANGDSRKSAIKQVASGRFGVTSEYLVSANEIQIKMAQGAKPGEGGQLPGNKVYPWIAKVRLSTPGVGLISPPPHHDIYSIEDLAELIHDLKNANPQARINVKLVAEVGVGTIAAGVAKGHADVVLISGHDGGTGASPYSSIKHAGLPWELGVAETHQTLVLNNLRSRIVVETDGQLRTGRDVAIATLLGAEEFGFATGPLVALGCIMMRACHLNTCPVGIATQDPLLRKKFDGDPQYVINYLRFIAQDLREIMALLGFRTLNEMVGRSDKLEMDHALSHWKAKGLDLSPILHRPEAPPEVGRYCQIAQDHGLDQSLDRTVLMDLCRPAIESGKAVRGNLKICNVNRVVGTIVGSEVTRKYGSAGLPDGTIDLTFKGSAGQSFGAFIPRGMTLRLEGDANDYVGKGLSGGRLAVFPPAKSTFIPEENIIIGNVAFYGATSGEAYVRGIAGERFCVRNSGVRAVVEGVGDHGCEYMTGGRVAVLGFTGRNFAAGMSGGVAYIYDEDGSFPGRINLQMVGLESLSDKEDLKVLREMLARHVEYTGSGKAKKILADWEDARRKFLVVMPKDYKRVLQAMKKVQSAGLSGEEAVMAAFEANSHHLARVGGN